MQLTERVTTSKYAKAKTFYLLCLVLRKTKLDRYEAKLEDAGVFDEDEEYRRKFEEVITYESLTEQLAVQEIRSYIIQFDLISKLRHGGYYDKAIILHFIRNDMFARLVPQVNFDMKDFTRI